MALVEYLVVVQVHVLLDSGDPSGKVQPAPAMVCARHAEIARENFQKSNFDGILWEIKKLSLIDRVTECPMCAKEKVLGVPYGA